MVGLNQSPASDHERHRFPALVARVDLGIGRDARHRVPGGAGLVAERTGQRALDGGRRRMRLRRRLAFSQRLANGEGADG